jgi:excisionase family DNA binding protein
MNTAILTTDQLCKVLEITRPTVLRLIQRGMPFFKIGRNRRFDFAEVLKFLKENS